MKSPKQTKFDPFNRMVNDPPQIKWHKFVIAGAIVLIIIVVLLFIFANQSSKVGSDEQKVDYNSSNEISTIKEIKYNGGFYEGYTLNGKPHGKGKIIWSDGLYDGDWENGKRNGFGIAEKYNEWIYEGDFVDDKSHGKGKIIWSDGTWYEGEWESDERTGFGISEKPNEWKYEGDFVDGQFEKGVLILSDGSVYNFDNGEIIE